jgi:N-carbamoyl-L-amino-acid hydrolase
LEVVRTLNDAEIATVAPIDLAVWTDEEGARFKSGMMGSSVFVGRASLDNALANSDADGKTMGSELQRIGYAGGEPVGGFPITAFFEAHIEQGPILEAEEMTIGVVLGAQARRNFRIVVEGEEGHAGTAPMDRRRDALLGAARMVDRMNAIAFRHNPLPVVTVGSLHVRPNSPNTIPGQVIFTIDSRHPETAVLSAVEAEIREECHGIAGDLGLLLTIERTMEAPPVVFDSACTASVKAAAERLGYSHRELYSGAGHDACNLAGIAPTAMIFVPCEKGISHNPAENADPEDLGAGGDVLLQVILERAGRA